MIKAVFFDLYYTLVTYDPPREDLIADALKEFGINSDPAIFRRPIVTADEFIYAEIARQPLTKRTQEEKLELYTRYQSVLLKEAGIDPAPNLVRGLLGKMQQAKMDLVLFDDVIAALQEMKKRKLITGLISNVEFDISPKLSELGITSLLDIVITSKDFGEGKPRPGIFQEAAKRAGVQPEEAIYIGDQYQVDYMGSTRAGMKGVLLDRYGYSADKTDCPRVQSLIGLTEYL
jgi:putative hydrolase of the HAD superfamily